MNKRYLVSFGVIPENRNYYMFNSMEIVTPEMKVKDMSPGMLAEYLEREVSNTIDAPSVVILNYWEM